MTKQLPRAHLSGEFAESERSWPLVTEFMDYLRRTGAAEGYLQEFPGPAKHLLVWLDRNRIGLDAVDGDVVRHFLTHRCNCPRPSGERYQTRHLHRPAFKGRIFHFVRFLEQSGRIANPSSLDEGLRRVGDFIAYLGEQRYSPGTVRTYEYGCRHFVTWLHQHRIPLEAIDEEVLRRFATHDCICPGMFVRKTERNREYQFRVERFVRFLITNGVLSSVASKDDAGIDDLRDFRDWLRRHRGTGEKTILDHVRTITRLHQQLGDDPARYDAALINQVMLENLKAVSRIGAQQMCGSLRMYLRFLASRGECSPALVGAIPRIPRWRLATLPRYILNDDVERVIASCDPTTPRGLRDRAILLLLARLALRRGDVANLRLQDIDWNEALIRVAGKTRYTVALPLPQDVGDALAAYIEHARPPVDSDRVFIRSIAPYKPFTDAGPISIVVSDALKRAGVDNPNLRGAHLLRHSAATNMVRSGATLDAVGALLRHRSPETTAIYAKVDTAMLMQVAQPWIGRGDMAMISDVERYVAIKRGLGYKFLDQAQKLRKYAAFAEAAGDTYTSASRMIEWAGTAPSVQSSREWLRVVRNFAISMHAENDRNEIPPRNAFGWGKRPRPRPHILSVPDIELIMQAALALPPVASITPYTYHYLIGLLAATGMRVSEAVALLESDLTKDGLLIRETKFHKSRLVPIHSTTRRALSEYLVLRRRIGGPDPHLFVISTGEPPDHASVTRAFIKLARQLGVRAAEGRGPRLHDLRHSFAARSLEQCGDDRADINRHMLALSTYLGHACITDTYWYLEATPILTRQIADAAAAAFREGGVS